MKKIIAAVAALVSCLSVPSLSATQVYTDRGAWQQAVGAYYEESFSDTLLNPGLAIESTLPGYVDTDRGVWWDSLYGNEGTGGPTTTLWLFGTPVVAFGGNWNCAGVAGSGTGIAVALWSSEVLVGEISGSYAGGFWGFVSTECVSGVLLRTGTGPGWTESYELDALSYVVIPEPSSLIVLLAGFVSLTGLASRRR